ncbi:hypothetical protein CsSME_00018563 [Camellia sinensis var. sinensis]
MAGVLETLTVPRASGFTSAKLSPIGSSSVCSLSGGRKSVLPEFRGLKIQSTSTTVSRGSVSLRLGRRGGRIVCEAQDTAVQGLDIVREKVRKQDSTKHKNRYVDRMTIPFHSNGPRVYWMVILMTWYH